MTDRLDDEIARVSAELNKLREQKMAELRREMLRLGDGTGAAAPAGRAKRRFTEGQMVDLLTAAVEEAGEAGISALKAAEVTSIPYNRARLLMPGLFKKKGSGGGTLYVLKPKRKG